MTKPQFIFGIRSVIEAVESGRDIDKVFIKRGLNNELVRKLTALLRAQNIPIQYVPIERINRITRKNHQGVVAYISPIEYQNIEEIVLRLFDKGETPFLLYLDQVTDVRNFGAIARTAACAGIHAVIVPMRGAAQINADAVKTSAGALHELPVCRVANPSKTIEFLKNSGIRVLAATEKSEKLYHQVDFTVPVVLVLGAEDKGISKQLLQLADDKIAIPITGKIQSLNVSVAAAVLMYEGIRQRLGTE